MTKCTNVCIDMFCFYAKISCRSHIIKSESAKVKIDDFSDGRETCPVVLINEISEDLPPHLAYISSRNKAEDVYINIDPGFLVCCDCTDFCQVRKLGLTFHSYFQNHLERCQKLISHDQRVKRHTKQYKWWWRCPSGSTSTKGQGLNSIVQYY